MIPYKSLFRIWRGLFGPWEHTLHHDVGGGEPGGRIHEGYPVEYQHRIFSVFL
jgi:hypothetical protein